MRVMDAVEGMGMARGARAADRRLSEGTAWDWRRREGCWSGACDARLRDGAR
jgi:hypothetical protein